MALNSEGRVILNIRDDKGNLLVAKPCTNTSEADSYSRDYLTKNPGKLLFFEVREIPPRI